MSNFAHSAGLKVLCVCFYFHNYRPIGFWVISVLLPGLRTNYIVEDQKSYQRIVVGRLLSQTSVCILFKGVALVARVSR